MPNSFVEGYQIGQQLRRQREQAERQEKLLKLQHQKAKADMDLFDLQVESMQQQKGMKEFLFRLQYGGGAGQQQPDTGVRPEEFPSDTVPAPGQTGTPGAASEGMVNIPGLGQIDVAKARESYLGFKQEERGIETTGKFQDRQMMNLADLPFDLEEEARKAKSKQDEEDRSLADKKELANYQAGIGEEAEKRRNVFREEFAKLQSKLVESRQKAFEIFRSKLPSSEASKYFNVTLKDGTQTFVKQEGVGDQVRLFRVDNGVDVTAAVEIKGLQHDDPLIAITKLILERDKYKTGVPE